MISEAKVINFFLLFLQLYIVTLLCAVLKVSSVDRFSMLHMLYITYILTLKVEFSLLHLMQPTVVDINQPGIK